MRSADDAFPPGFVSAEDTLKASLLFFTPVFFFPRILFQVTASKLEL